MLVIEEMTEMKTMVMNLHFFCCRGIQLANNFNCNASKIVISALL